MKKCMLTFLLTVPLITVCILVFSLDFCSPNPDYMRKLNALEERLDSSQIGEFEKDINELIRLWKLSQSDSGNRHMDLTKQLASQIVLVEKHASEIVNEYASINYELGQSLKFSDSCRSSKQLEIEDRLNRFYKRDLNAFLEIAAAISIEAQIEYFPNGWLNQMIGDIPPQDLLGYMEKVLAKKTN